jgi:hypothetical protein
MFDEKAHLTLLRFVEPVVKAGPLRSGPAVRCESSDTHGLRANKRKT